MTPVAGDLMVWRGNGPCGVSGGYGHVAVVNHVWNPGSVEVVQQNWGDSAASAVMTFDTSCACAFIHSTDNGNQNPPPVPSPPSGTPSSSGSGNQSGQLDCPDYTDDSDPLKQAGLKACCVRSESLQTTWPIPCDGSLNGTGPGSTFGSSTTGGNGTTGSPVAGCVAYAKEINAAAAANGIDPTLLAAIAAQETGGPGSNGGRNIVGDNGHGHGLFQIDDRWNAFARTPAAMDPAANAMFAAQLFKAFLERAGGNIKGAISAYNAGSPGACGTKTTWPDGTTLCYADSVLRHQKAIQALGPNCGA
jgi:hypothetical protein